MSDYVVPMLFGLACGCFLAIKVANLMEGCRQPRFRDEPLRVKAVLFSIPTAMTLIAALVVFIDKAVVK